MTESLPYKELNSRLKFPANPAYYKLEENDTKSLLDFCREHDIPFNEIDQLLYKLKKSKDIYSIYRVLFDQLTNNNKPFEAAKSMMN